MTLQKPEMVGSIMTWLWEHLRGQGIEIACHSYTSQEVEDLGRYRVVITSIEAADGVPEDFDLGEAWRHRDMSVPGWASIRMSGGAGFQSFVYDFEPVVRPPVPVLPNPPTQLLQGLMDPITLRGCPLARRLSGYTKRHVKPMRRWRA